MPTRTWIPRREIWLARIRQEEQEAERLKSGPPFVWPDEEEEPPPPDGEPSWRELGREIWQGAPLSPEFWESKLGLWEQLRKPTELQYGRRHLPGVAAPMPVKAETPLEKFTTEWAAPIAALSAIPVTAVGMRAALASAATRPGLAGVASKIARGVLKPGEAVELAPGKAIRKIFKPKVTPEKLTNELPFRTPELTPYKAKKQIKLVANELIEHLGVPPKKPILVITHETMKQTAWNRIGEKTGGFVNRTYRVENLLLRADKYVDEGKMWQAIWKPIEQATNRQVGRLYNRHAIFMRILKENKIDLGRWLNQKIDTEGIILTPLERIGIYLHSRNADNLVHMVFGNNIPARTITSVVKSLTPEERLVGDFFAKFYTRQTPIMQAITKQVTGKPLKAVENYFPLQLQRKAMQMLDFNEFVISEGQLRGASRWASARIRKGFTLPRTGKGMQPVELDALSVWLRHLEGTEHYKAFAPVIRDLQRLIANGSFRYALTNSQGKHVVPVLEQWLKDVAMTNPLAPRNQFEAFARTMRVNAVTAVLGVNVLTALKQFPSYFAGMAEVGTMPVMRGLFTFLRHPDQTMKLLRQYAPQIYKRRFEREIAEAAAMRGLKAIVPGNMSAKQVFMLMTTTMDRLAVNSIWRGGFDDALRQGKAVTEAAEYATRAIRRTQPYFGIKDIPEYWRAGELAKGLTIFTNQLNQYWNYYRFHILGKRLAGRISNFDVAKRLVETFVVPALVIGTITRSRPPQDIGEFVKDFTSMGLATVPIFGNWVVSGIRGFTSSGIITTELLDEIRQLAYQTNREAWDKVAVTLPKLAGYAAGIPVAQPARTLRAIWDLAEGNTEDWMELIWGSYVRKAALEEGEEKPIEWSKSEEKLKWPTRKESEISWPR